MSQKIILTGATGGFGKLTALKLAGEGHQVVGTTRSISKYQETANELQAAGVQLVEMDVTDTAAVDAGVAKAIELLGGLDVVINNAGVGTSGMVEHFTPEDVQRIFDVNVVGVQRVNRAALPHLRQQGSGLIMNISSLLGRITLPFYGVYNASKWALEALTENYRAELSGFGVESVLIEPGGFPTEFGANLMQPSDNSRTEAYGDFMNVPGQMGEAFMQTLANTPGQKPEIVADAIADVIAQPHGSRPFRTEVDVLGMGDLVKGLNGKMTEVTNGLYGSFGIDGMLQVATPEAAN